MLKRNLRIINIFLFLGAILISPVFAQESIIIAAYHPSPSGIYAELRAQRAAVGPVAFDPAEVCWTNDCTYDVDRLNPHTTVMYIEDEMRIVTFDDLNQGEEPALYIENRAPTVNTRFYMGAGGISHNGTFIELRGNSAANSITSVDFSSNEYPYGDPYNHFLQHMHDDSRTNYDARVYYSEKDSYDDFRIEAPHFFVWDRNVAAPNLRFLIRGGTGNVGIGLTGTSSAALNALDEPSSRLRVIGIPTAAVMALPAFGRHTARFDGDNGFGVGIGGYLSSGGTNLNCGSIEGYSPTATAPLVLNSNGFPVGIGLDEGASPTFPFEVYNSLTTRLPGVHVSGVGDGQNYSALFLHDATADQRNAWVIAHKVASDNLRITWYNNAGTAINYMTFLGASNTVGIGTDTPDSTATLDVKGGPIYGQLRCKIRRNSEDTDNTHNGVNVACNSDERGLAGGGQCYGGATGTLGFHGVHLFVSEPVTDAVGNITGWHSDCYSNNKTNEGTSPAVPPEDFGDCGARAWVLCCRYKGNSTTP